MSIRYLHLFPTIIFLSILSSYQSIGQEVTLPYFQDFDTGTSTGSPGTLPTDWINFNEGSSDNCDHGNTFCRDWGVRSGSTPSNNTGPSGDHTSGSGRYVYMEASGNNNSEVLLISPSFNLNGSSANLDFWIHNYNGNNSNSHTLQIRVVNEAITTNLGGVLASYTETNTNAWVSEQVDLSSFSGSGNIRVVFRWVKGGGTSNWWQHDIAIDDVSISTSITAEICDNNTDDDGDGLVDCLDNDCDGQAICDTDGDTVPNRIDQDDDNDGIPDALECYDQANLINNAGFESGDSGFSSDLDSETCTSDCGPSNDVNSGDYGIYTNACGCGGQSGGGVQQWTGDPIEGDSMMVINFPTSGTDNLWYQTVSVDPYTEYSFNVWVKNISFTDENDPEIQLAYSTNGGGSYTVIGESGPLTEAEDWQLIGYNFVTGNVSSIIVSVQNAISGASGNDLAIDGLSLLNANCDDDGDGVASRLDLDSDNDGIYDVFESSSGAAQSGGALTGGVDADGIPNSVSDGNGFVDYVASDSDNDGLLDLIELDSDDDGCFDSFEENIEDLDNDGIAGTGIPAVDADGLVTAITYTTPTLNSWQDPDEDNPFCDGDTDDDGIPDDIDLDDDNDGIPDIIESPATIDFGGTRTLIVGTDITNMAVGDVVVYSDAIRDCDDIFYDVTITINSISPGSVVEADFQGMLIKNAAANEDDHFTFTLSVVESGSATSGNPAGTAATIDDFLFTPRDIDSNSAATGDTDIDHTEVFGVSNSTIFDTSYFDPLTVLEEGGFINGLGPGSGYTYYRMAPVSGPNDWSANDNDITGEDIRFAVFLFYSSFSSVDIAYGRTGSAGSNSGGTRLTNFFGSKECDRDGDGVPNRVDLDLDNDGIYDLYEAGHSFTADVDGDGMIDGADTGSGGNGLFDGVETSAESGNVNYSYSNSDNDTEQIYDFFELDSDDDNCFDTEEADIADADVDGTAGTGAPTSDAFGRVTSITYIEPPTMNWQDPLQSCLEICDNGMDDDGDGLIDGFDPDCADYYLEAECGFPGANWVRTFDLDASNNDFQTITTGLNSLDNPPTAAADILRFTVTTLAAGTYRILGRVNSASGADDSFWFRVDEGTWYKWNDWDTGGTWEWIEFSDNDNGNTPVRYALGVGSHSIDIAYREDGAGIDKLHLTINGSTPAGEGEEAINCNRSITTNLFLNYKIRNRTN